MVEVEIKGKERKTTRNKLQNELSHTSSEADPFDPDYWTWDEAEKNYYHIDKATSEKLWYEAPP
jgi:hypothetical protein